MSVTINSDTIATNSTITLGANNSMYAQNNGNAYSSNSKLNSIVSRGSVVQTIYKRYDTKSTWASSANVNTIISDLDMTIYPKYPKTSIILVRYCLSFEMHNDTLFRLMRNGKYGSVNGSSQQNDPYNMENPSANRWVGTFVSGYDQDTSSTPSTRSYMYMDRADGDTTITYNLACSSSGGSNYTLYMNRTVSSSGQDSYENGISSVIIQEIA